MILSVFRQFPFGHDTDNIMAKGKLTKDIQYHWQREIDKKTDNIMAKVKLTIDRQYHGQRETDKRETISRPYCLSFVSFPFSMILAVFCQFPFGYDVVCLMSVSLCP
jgi:hypothetical protein